MPTKEFDLQIGNDFFEKSDNPDMVYKWSRSEVYLRGIEMSLENQIARLEEQIASASEPQPAPEPMPIPTEELEKQKTELQGLFDKLKGVK
jgi:hypothetical protein